MAKFLSHRTCLVFAKFTPPFVSCLCIVHVCPQCLVEICKRKEHSSQNFMGVMSLRPISCSLKTMSSNMLRIIDFNFISNAMFNLYNTRGKGRFAAFHPSLRLPGNQSSRYPELAGVFRGNIDMLCYISK